jgi:hypothetical protein
MEFRKMNRTIAIVRNGRNTERNLRDIMAQHLPIEMHVAIRTEN